MRFGSLVIHNPQVTADDETNAAFMPMTLIDAGYGSSYTYETKKWETIKTGFTKIAIGDIAYAKITPCFQNRKSFILGEVPGRVAAATTELNVIRTYANTLDEWYILYFLKSEYFIKEARYKGTAGQQRVLTDYVQNKLVPLPPLNEQKRIVQKIKDTLPIIRTYGKSQEALDKLNAEIFDKLKKSVLQEAIQGKLVPQDPNDEPALVLLERIKEEKAKLVKEGKLKKKDLVDSVIFKDDDNKYYEQIGNEVVCIDDELPFEIPDSWEWCRLGNCVSYQNGYAYTSTELNKDKKGLPVIKSGNLMTYEVVLKSNNDYVATPTDKMLASMITKGDLLMCLSSQSDNPEPLGKTAIYKEETPALLNQRVLKMRPYINCILEYLYITINSEYFHYTVSLQSGGSAQANLKLEHVLNMLVPLPPLKEQKRIINKLEEINKGIED